MEAMSASPSIQTRHVSSSSYFNSVFKWKPTLRVLWFKFLGFASYLEHVGSKVQSILLWNYKAPHP